MGSNNIEKLMPPIVKKIKDSKLNVVWSCDPMHANIEKTNNGYKTRNFKNILKEVKLFFKIHKNLGTYAGGIHLEMTGQNVTECIGGLQKISQKDLGSRYHTHCDPRLNASQSLELAFNIVSYLKFLNEIKEKKIIFFLLQKSSVVGDIEKNYKVLKNLIKNFSKNCDFFLTTELFFIRLSPSRFNF